MNEADAHPTRATRTLLIVLAVTFVYSGLRYHVFGGVPWSQLPLYVTNKATSWAALTLLALAYISRDGRFAREAGMLGLLLSATHVILSQTILDPAYYDKLYVGAHFSAIAETALLAGVGAATVLIIPAVATLPGVRANLGEDRWRRWLRAGHPGLALVALHCALLGCKGWFAPGTWPGYMPPITLIATLIALAPMLARRRR